MPTALAYSCDTYFYRLGNDFYLLPSRRGQPMQTWASKFGFGQPTKVEGVTHASGLLPTIGWKHAHYTRKSDACCWQVDRLWKPGDSIQLAIGQGDLTVTPLQMARFYSAIANGGKLVQPHMLLHVENPNKTLVATPVPSAPRPIAGLSRRRSGSCRRDSSRPPTHPSARPPLSSATSRCRSRERPARPRSSSRFRAARPSRISRGGAGTARTTRQSSSSAQ